MKFESLKIRYDEGSIILDESRQPFNGESVLIQTHTGIVEAFWDRGDDNWQQWICYDDMFRLELDEVIGWMPIPELVKERTGEDEQ